MSESESEMMNNPVAKLYAYKLRNLHIPDAANLIKIPPYNYK